MTRPSEVTPSAAARGMNSSTSKIAPHSNDNSKAAKSHDPNRRDEAPAYRKLQEANEWAWQARRWTTCPTQVTMPLAAFNQLTRQLAETQTLEAGSMAMAGRVASPSSSLNGITAGPSTQTSNGLEHCNSANREAAGSPRKPMHPPGSMCFYNDPKAADQQRADWAPGHQAHPLAVMNSSAGMQAPADHTQAQRHFLI